MEFRTVVGVAVALAPIAIVALVNLVRPTLIVRWQGRFYRRWYKGYLQMPDEAIDRLPQLPSDRLKMGTRSHFINRAPEHPEEFPKLLSIYRWVGVMFASILILTLFLLIYGAATGRLQVGP